MAKHKYLDQEDVDLISYLREYQQDWEEIYLAFSFVRWYRSRAWFADLERFKTAYKREVKYHATQRPPEGLSTRFQTAT